MQPHVKVFLDTLLEFFIEDVKFAVKSLNSGISKDPYGHPNEIFKSGVAGEGLLKAITILMNKLKQNPSDYPEAMELCNVTTIYKNKGDKKDFNSYRGVFRTTSLRNIMDRLIYIDEYQTVDDSLTDCNVGSRRHRNIRYNLFVMNAIMNASKKENENACDILIYDVEKCFDSLWLSECINDIFEAGVNNDKLCLLYHSNKNARIAVKTPSGVSERFTINNTVMQGTVWAGLKCTTTMDKLGKQAYEDPNLLYRYKNLVDIPPLQMVDDIIAASQCGNQTNLVNSAITTFAKLKKLKLSYKKCARLHISKNSCNSCPDILIDNKQIKDSEKEKYLGDYLTKFANPLATMESRRQKGEGILANIRAMLEDVPLGNKRLEIGLTLREAWFINGTLYNSEVWCSYKTEDLKVLEVLDRKILREITGAHSKAPWEMLYLETATLPISSVIIARRLNYLQTILKRNNEEVIWKVYTAQKSAPTKGDWTNLVQ